MKLVDYLSRQPKYMLWLISALGMAIVGFLDYSTGTELGLSPFYLLPIAIVAWFIGRRSGIMAATLGAIVWF